MLEAPRRGLEPNFSLSLGLSNELAIRSSFAPALGRDRLRDSRAVEGPEAPALKGKPRAGRPARAESLLTTEKTHAACTTYVLDGADGVVAEPRSARSHCFLSCAVPLA